MFKADNRGGSGILNQFQIPFARHPSDHIHNLLHFLPCPDRMEISSLSTLVLFYHLQAILALLSVLTAFHFSHFAVSFQLRAKERQSFHGSGATRTPNSQGMTCRKGLARFMVFRKTNSPTLCHPVSGRTVQVQCFVRQSSEKLSVSFYQGPEGTNISYLSCTASRGTSIPEPSAHYARRSTEDQWILA